MIDVRRAFLSVSTIIYLCTLHVALLVPSWEDSTLQPSSQNSSPGPLFTGTKFIDSPLLTYMYVGVHVHRAAVITKNYSLLINVFMFDLFLSTKYEVMFNYIKQYS